MFFKKYIKNGFLLIIVGIIFGCSMKYQPIYENAQFDNPTDKSEALAKQARNLFEMSNDRRSLLTSIEAHLKVLDINPGDYSTLVTLSTQHILLGTAYTDDSEDKSKNFIKAMRYAELAMYTNADFRKSVAEGTAPWDAVESLNKGQVEAMFFWVTALQYEFKEGMNLAEKIVNVSWMERGLKFLDRVEELDPDFGGGAVEFAKVICYYVLPKSKGGSKAKGDDYMRRSVERADGWLLPMWGRGKYYHVIRGEDAKSRADLEWVATRDLNEFKDPMPWKIHFQANADEILKK